MVPKPLPTGAQFHAVSEKLAAAHAAGTLAAGGNHDLSRLPQASIVRHLREVFGVTVRTRNMFSNAVAAARGLVGGEVGSYTKLMVGARAEAIGRLRQEADGLGANAVISMRFTANQISSDMTKFAACGAAVLVVWTTEQSR